MATLNFFVEKIKFSLKQKTIIRQWIQGTISNEKKILGELNYIFCSDKFLLNINKTFLNHDTLTDIITFPVEPLYGSLAPIKNKALVNGEIYISIERVKANAKLFNSDFDSELKRVIIHGVLHLCGYGDKGTLQEKKMRKQEAYYLNQLGA